MVIGGHHTDARLRTDITFATTAPGLTALSPITSCNSGGKSYKLSDRISNAGPRNVPGSGPDGAYDGPDSSL